MKTEKNEIKNLVIIIIIVVAVFGLFILITSMITKPKPREVTPSTIQYKEIILESINTLKGDYLVIVYSEADSNNPYYESLAEKYEKKLYTAHLENGFNKKHLGPETIIENTINLSKFKETSLLEVSNHKIKSSYKTDEEIANRLK